MGFWMNEDERLAVGVRSRMAVNRSMVAELDSVDQFLMEEWSGLDSFKIVFYIFHKFQVISAFSIKAATLFTFLYRLREAYGGLPFHNIERAVDSLQFVASQLGAAAQFSDGLLAIEKLVLFVATLGHDPRHSDTPVHPNAEVASGFLLKGDSLVEMGRCQGLVEVLSHQPANPLRNSGSEDLGVFLGLVVRLALSLDARLHYAQLEGLMARGTANASAAGDRERGMTALLKASTMAHMVRTADVATFRCDARDQELEIQDGPPAGDPKDEAVRRAEIRHGIGQLFVAPFFSALVYSLRPVKGHCGHIQGTLKQWSDEPSALRSGKKKG